MINEIESIILNRYLNKIVEEISSESINFSINKYDFMAEIDLFFGDLIVTIELREPAMCSWSDSISGLKYTNLRHESFYSCHRDSISRVIGEIYSYRARGLDFNFESLSIMLWNIFSRIELISLTGFMDDELEWFIAGSGGRPFNISARFRSNPDVAIDVWLPAVEISGVGHVSFGRYSNVNERAILFSEE